MGGICSMNGGVVFFLVTMPIMTLRSTHLLQEMSTMSISWGVKAAGA